MDNGIFSAILILLFTLGMILMLGGLLSLSFDEENKVKKEEVKDLFFGFDLYSVIYSNFAKNWKRKKEAKALFCIGITMFLVSIFVRIIILGFQ